jgi:hypothetical protein
MKKYFLISLFIILIIGSAKAQNWTEGFETTDTLTLPAGWSIYNAANFPIDPATNWNVRDSGKSLPGLASAKSRSHSGIRAIGVSWWAAVDTLGLDTTQTANAWLVTKRIHVWAANSYLSFWWTGGSTNYLDSFQVWISTVDSLPNHFTHYILTESRRATYGVFQQEFIPFDDFIGQTIWVGFRYNTDTHVDGYFVHLDDFEVSNPIGIQNISSEIPKRFDLKQNYPNPFNPTTNIEFDIAKQGNVKLIIYNEMGQEIATLVNQELKAGSYRYDFNAGKLASGMYFYRLITDQYAKTNKMILVK